MKSIIRKAIQVWKIAMPTFIWLATAAAVLMLTPGISAAGGHENIGKTMTRATWYISETSPKA